MAHSSASRTWYRQPSIEAPALNVETVSSATFTPAFPRLRVRSARLGFARMCGSWHEQAARILQQQDQLLLARRRRLESEPQVKARCGFVDRVGEQSTDASLICNYKRATDRVLKQANAEPRPWSTIDTASRARMTTGIG